MMPLLEEIMQDVSARFGGSGLERIEAMFDIISGEKSPTPAPLQDVSLGEGLAIYIPGLSATPWHDPGAFAWRQELEAAAGSIKQEMLDTIRSKANLEPYGASYDVSGGLLGEQQAPEQVLDTSWVATFFYKSFQRVEAKCELCPTTAAIIDRIGVAREALFSVLEPGAYIPPHSDRMNFVVTCHLGLIIPNDCALRVGTETRTWEEQRCFFFDSSFEHEAWNRSGQRRVVLLMDVWHPELTAKEVEVLKYLRPHIEMLLGATPRA